MEKRILLVEDDETSQYVYATVLRHRGYSVLQARSAQEGIRLAREQRPDAIVMDLGMPMVDGFEATARIKQDPETSHIPIVVVTVHVYPEDEEKAWSAGCTVFCRKPFEPTRLADQISDLIGPPSQVPLRE